MKTISFRLNTADIKRAIREMEQHRDSLPLKCEEFVSRLVSMGISVASVNTGEFGDLIGFMKEVNLERYGATAVLIARSSPYPVQWINQDGIQEVDISPILMAEFGSGFLASDAGGGAANAEVALKLGMGQGTFPGQTHAFQDGGWKWMDLDGEWHESIGIAPSMPVWKAYMEIKSDIETVAKVVFSS